jgi:2,3-bisphosphoglycerate-independent phosphoglycerate mutase
MILDEIHWQLATGAGLNSIAPTVLQLMGLEQPDTMVSKSLLVSPVAKAV